MSLICWCRICWMARAVKWLVLNSRRRCWKHRCGAGQGKQATEASMKAADLLVQAASMAQKADLLELEAEAALLKSELGIEQHLLDFPDADVA